MDFVNESSGLPQTYLGAAVAPGVDNHGTDDVDEFSEAGGCSTNTDVVFLSAYLAVGVARAARTARAARAARAARGARV